MANKSSKTFRLAQRVKALRQGKSFDVADRSERTLAVQAATSLRAAGVIDFKVITKANENGGFTIYAV